MGADLPGVSNLNGTRNHNEGFPAEFSQVVRGSEHYFLVDFADRRTIKVFDLSGGFVRSIGRDGEGPGEFRQVTDIAVSSQDSLLALDSDLARISVFGPDLAFSHSFSVVPVATWGEDSSLTPLPNGDVLVTGRIGTRDLVGIPHHRFDRSGKRVSSFGDPPVRGSFLREQVNRPATLDDPGAVWVAHAEEYSLTLWSLSGEKRETFHPVRGWFEDSRYIPGGMQEGDGVFRPHASLMDIEKGAKGYLWVLGRGPDLEWRESLGPGGERGELEAYFDYFLEVFSEEGKLIAARRVQEGLLLGFLDAEHLFGTIYEGGGFRTAIWRIHLETGETPTGVG